jgi:uncharacterized membrane protein
MLQPITFFSFFFVLNNKNARQLFSAFFLFLLLNVILALTSARSDVARWEIRGRRENLLQIDGFAHFRADTFSTPLLKETETRDQQ